MQANPRLADSSPSPVQQGREPWYLLETEQVLQRFQTNPLSGLTPERVHSHLERFGSNTLPKLLPRSDLEIILDQFKSMPVALLSVASLVSLLTGSLSDALVIMVVVLINALIGYATESHSDRIIRSLDHVHAATTQVIRGGNSLSINAQEVVPGDLLVLQLGLSIVADARVIEAENLSLDESVLTGESVPVTKTAQALMTPEIALGDRCNMVYQGTRVIGGQGFAIVVATGQQTEMGQIQALVGQLTPPKTPIEHQLDQLGSQLVVLSSIVCAIIFALGLVRGYGLLEMLKTSISLAVAAVPEGLPAVATTTLALGIWSMRQQKILIRRLNAVETLGAVQSLCLDKTGTLTENRMSVVEALTDQPPCLLKASPQDSPLLQSLVLCNDSTLIPKDNHSQQFQGSATENALLQFAISAGMDIHQLREQYPRLKTLYRTTEHNWMKTIHLKSADHFLVALKGNPQEVLAQCQFFLDQAGKPQDLTLVEQQRILNLNDQMAGRALRVLGVAFGETTELEDKQPHLVWAGLVGLADPIRAEVPPAIAMFHQAGIETIMVTGDQSSTALAIGQSLNLSQGQLIKLVTGSELSAIAPIEATAPGSSCCQMLQEPVHIFARISPGDKLQVIQALQQSGKVVAMIGDGINDSLALKAANVGIVMGCTGTEAAREVADVVLEEDNLSTMAIAIQQGRTIYNNIRKSVHFLLSTNLSEILVMFVSTCLGLGHPLNAMQLLWLNLVTDIFPGLALALEAPESHILHQPPRDSKESIIPALEFRRITLESVILSVSALCAYGYALWHYGMGEHASTLGFMSLTLAQLLHALSCRSQSPSVFTSPQLPANRYLAIALTGSIALQLVTLAIPEMRHLLHLSLLNGMDLAVIALAAFMPLLINDLTKSGSSPVP